ncbi:hypothetical protein CGMCC3_g947 [Colletotrichum fructicola]|nr:uncharacterized protein CGMCC3_g947 [Colletotrichum fructicola]KAE9582810.1 hypothetical protein CGMCC3_g947 [Colletotrichum fructicola]
MISMRANGRLAGSPRSPGERSQPTEDPELAVRCGARRVISWHVWHMPAEYRYRNWLTLTHPSSSLPYVHIKATNAGHSA